MLEWWDADECCEASHACIDCFEFCLSSFDVRRIYLLYNGAFVDFISCFYADLRIYARNCL